MPKAFCSDHVRAVHKPHLLSDNGSSYVSGDLAEWLQDKGEKPFVFTSLRNGIGPEKVISLLANIDGFNDPMS